MKKSDLRIIRGGREELERKLLRAVFRRNGKKTVVDLRQRLARRGDGRLQAVNLAPPKGPAASHMPTDSDPDKETPDGGR